MDNLDMAKLMNMLSKVDKKDLEKSMEIANKIMKSENKDEIIKNLKNNLSGMYDLEKVEEVLEKYGFDLSVRAEELSEEILVDLCKNIS